MEANGKHEPPQQRCGNCRFWRQRRQQPEEGYCQRFPPQIIQSLHGGRMDLIDSGCSAEPITLDMHWCGEYQPTKTAEVEQVRRSLGPSKADRRGDRKTAKARLLAAGLKVHSESINYYARFLRLFRKGLSKREIAGRFCLSDTTSVRRRILDLAEADAGVRPDAVAGAP